MAEGRHSSLQAAAERRASGRPRLLGVPAGADAGAIRAAHRRLVADVHPDRGGSDEATRRANAARDLLLERLRRPQQ